MGALEAKAFRVTFPKQGGMRVLDVGTSGVTTDVDSIATAAVLISAATEQTVLAASFDGTEQTAVPARNVILVLNSHADWDATTAVVLGTTWDGRTQRETLAIPNGGNATVAGVRLFKTVTSIYIPAQSGTNGTATLGWGSIFSLEEFVGSYVCMAGDQSWSLIGDAPGATITQPDQATTGDVASDARAMVWAASTPQPFFVTSDRCACKADMASAGILRWFRCEAPG